MNLFEFIAALVGALAWPGLVLALFLIFRQPLAELIPFLERLKYKDLELNFSKRVREVAIEADAVITTEEPVAVDEQLEELVDIYPRGAIIESWLLVENATVNAVRVNKLIITERDMKSPSRLVRVLEAAKIINKQQAALLHELRYIRNAAVHVTDLSLSPNAAREYVKTATRVAIALKSKTN
ncbi:hypothetical protein KAX02_05845 [candidate division WOR-3 bacterium]|nr:hypothetical protein [candidate division WOR-3 bacterium]